MAVNFPSNPTNGQTITASGITYAYDSTQGVWSDSPQGLTQAIDALTDVDTSTSAPSNGQTLQWNSTDSEWQPADSSAGVTVYATIDDLPLTGIAEGSMALVDSTDKLYIFSDAGWYSISIVNTTPSISGVNTAYSLAQDGTATTVTVSATDPEGLPLTYSIVSDTSGNVATVAQGTGSNTNQWTITPTTNTANAGNFTLVFRASDGVNIASASSTFSLVFVLVIPNSQYTSALFTSVGANNAGNNSFDDASTNNHTTTAIGSVTQSTFSPYRHGGYSTYFDGTTDYLKVTDSAEHDFGTGDFSMEFFWWPETVTGNSANIHIMISAPNNGHNQFIYHESNYWYFQSGSGGATVIPSSTGAVTAKAWNHVVLCRSGTTMSIFNNGSRTATIQSSAAVDFSHATIGRYDGGGYEIDGYVRDVRLVKGSSIYDATQTSITVPTEPLTAVTNTTLLTCHLPYIADGSTNSHAITVNGNTKTEPFAPYEYLEYDAADHGGSMYFDGNDSLSLPQTSLDLGSDDFCVEAWAYTTSASNQCIVGSYRYADGVGAWNLNINYAGKKIRFYINHSSGGVVDGQFESGTFPTNQWVHVAVTRDGSNLRAFINGTQAGSTNTSIGSSTINNAQTHYYVGVATDSQIYWQGYISDVRVVKGSSVYTSAFTPPTAPLTAITNTSLLLNGTDAGIIDKSQSVKTITLNGDTKSSTTQAKYLTSSMYFDGTGDSLSLPDSTGFNFGSGDSTIEMWVYPLGTGTFNLITRGTSNFSGFILSSTGFLDSTTGSSWNVNITFSTAITANSWQHVAVVRNGSTITVYRNGTSVGTASISGAVTSAAQSLVIGERAGQSNFQGYMSDVRITKGLARYTSNFTAPTDALEG